MAPKPTLFSNDWLDKMIKKFSKDKTPAQKDASWSSAKHGDLGVLGKSKQKRKPRKLWTSAGGVVLRSLKDREHVYVIKPSNNYGPWAFPKGQVDKGESKKQAALREVWEETGLKARIIDHRKAYLGSGKGSYSITHFYLMVKTGGSPHPTDETEEVRLVTWKEAKRLFRSSGNRRDVEIAKRAQVVLGKMKELKWK
jgi:8-oxo-dGTP diphosphatase